MINTLPANIKSKVIIFGDNIGTDQICSGDSDIFDRSRLSEGIVIVAGDGFGQGNHSADAVAILKGAGVSCVLARGIARKFYRAAINSGLPVIVGEIPKSIRDGSEIELDFEKNRLTHFGKAYDIPPFPVIIQKILDSGGLIPYIKNEIAK